MAERPHAWKRVQSKAGSFLICSECDLTADRREDQFASDECPGNWDTRRELRRTVIATAKALRARVPEWVKADPTIPLETRELIAAVEALEAFERKWGEL